MEEISCNSFTYLKQLEQPLGENLSHHLFHSPQQLCGSMGQGTSSYSGRQRPWRIEKENKQITHIIPKLLNDAAIIKRFEEPTFLPYGTKESGHKKDRLLSEIQYCNPGMLEKAQLHCDTSLSLILDVA